MPDMRAKPLAELIEHCQRQTLQYLHTKKLGDTSYCLELFRRAVQEGDERAWAFLYTFYSTEEFLGEHYLLKWVRSWLNGRHGAVIRARYTEEEMVQEIWLRFMRSEAAREFRFSDMRYLMAFLRRLTNNFALDAARRKAPPIAEPGSSMDRGLLDVDELLCGVPDDHKAIVDRMASQEAMDNLLDEIIGRIITTEREWLVFQCYFLDELPPRKVYELHPGVFARGEVETIRTRLTRRLRKAPYLLSRYIKVIVLEDDERRKLVFDYSVLTGWPDSRLLECYPTLFRDKADVVATRTQVLETLRSQPALLRALNVPASGRFSKPV